MNQKKVDFLEIQIEGFGSIIGPLVFKFKKRGLTIIRGVNGVGKTTILSAVAWAAYAVTLKNKASVLTWEHRRPDTYKGCKVALKFRRDGVLYEVIRCKEYKGKVEGTAGKNRVFIYKEGVLEPEAKLRNANPYLVNLIGMSFELFRASVVFGQKMKRLVEESGPDKKKVLEEAFNIAYIEKAKKLASGKLDKWRAEYAKINLEVTKWEATLKAKEEEYENLKNILAEFEADKALKIAGLQAKLDGYKAKANLTEKFQMGVSIQKWELKITDLKLRVAEAEAKQLELKAIQLKKDLSQAAKDKANENIEKWIKERDIIKTNKCDKCGSTISGAKTDELVNELTTDINSARISIADINKAILGYKMQLSSAQKADASSIDKYNKKIALLASQVADFESDIRQIDTYAKLSDEVKEEIKVERKRKPLYRMDEVQQAITELKEKIEPQQSLLDKLVRKVQIYNWMVTVPLSNSGLKNYIFNQMLSKVNQRLATYANRIGFKAKFEVDMQSALKNINVIVYQNNYPVPFEDLSGGQSQLINIAIAFSVHDVTAEDNINILLLDEVFESLSEENVEIVSNLIGEKAQDKAIYLVTHLKELITQGSQTIEVSASKGVTQIS